MAIINRSNQLYDALPSGASFGIAVQLSGDFAAVAYNRNADAAFDAALRLAGDFASQARDRIVNAEFDGALNLAGDFLTQVYTPGDADFNAVLNLKGDFECDTAFVFTEPVPITPTVSLDAFSNQRYVSGGGRLYINNVLTPFRSADINAPIQSLGETLSIELARANLSQLPANAAFKFQIGKIVNGDEVWTTILDGGKLSGRNFSMSAGRNDSLSFTTSESDSKLDVCPLNNLIVFDPSKGDVSVEETEPLYTNTDEAILTESLPVSVLTLYKLLEIAYVDGCGFAGFETDIPNYEVARCDFTVTNSYNQAVAQFIGMYEPEFSVRDDRLVIQKTIDPLPPGFTPNPLYASRYPSFSESFENRSVNIDGYILQYTSVAGTRFADRNLPTVIEPSGFFGDPGFTETTVRRSVRDWFETGSPVAVRTESKAEVRETRRAGIEVGRESLINTFDRLGRPTGYTRTLHARMPDVTQNGAPSLLKTREESQKIAYKSNPFAPRQTHTSKIETVVRGLQAIDSDNTALDENGADSAYGQDYEKVFEAGNLKTEMTSSFSTLEVISQYFRPQANGQIDVRVERFDALRGKPKTPDSGVRSGDVSIPNYTRQRSKTIFKAGVTQASRTGKPLLTLNTGELPLYFAEPLAEWLLLNPPVTGQIEVTGYDESLDRGVFFALKGRSGEHLGNFKTRGYRVKITLDSIMTTLDAKRV